MKQKNKQNWKHVKMEKKNCPVTSVNIIEIKIKVHKKNGN